MRDALMLFVHLVATIAKLLTPGGARKVIAESVLLRLEGHTHVIPSD